MSIEAMKLALEALESDPISHAWLVSRKQAITALRQALETKQEPVAWMHNETELLRLARRANSGDFEPSHWRPLYTAPPKKEWVGLTDEEIQDLGYLSQKIDEGNSPWFDRLEFARAIEAKLKEKNQ